MKTTITPEQSKEAEKQISNVESGLGIKQSDDSTLQFGVGRGIRRASQLSNSVIPLSKVESQGKL